LMEIEVKEDRAVLMKTDRVETVVIIIHNFVLR